jgi:hypothetical protein
VLAGKVRQVTRPQHKEPTFPILEKSSALVAAGGAKYEGRVERQTSHATGRRKPQSTWAGGTGRRTASPAYAWR